MEKKEKKNEKNALVIVSEENKVNKEAIALQQEIERRTAELQHCLAELERKRKLSENRTEFIAVMDKLEKSEDTLLQEEGFNTNSFKLRFGEANAYRDEDVFVIGNREIILDFIHFIRGKITEKVREIEAQLMA